MNVRDLKIPHEIKKCDDVKTVYCWFWRFYPKIKAQSQPEALLYPANKILPDCPLHSYQATVSALAGAIYPKNWSSEVESKTQPEHPYLILFTFSPIQEFIKASRKFLDFWAGSYLLHYLGAKLCWYIANKYGEDAVITPSLWQQEIIDALILHKYPTFSQDFARLSEDGLDPITRFKTKKSTSLATAGFPNVITALVPGKAEAEKLGKELADFLKQEWQDMALKVRNNLKDQVRTTIGKEEDTEEVKKQKLEQLWKKIGQEFKQETYQAELLKWQTGTCWTWNSLWDAQINNTWETYWTAVPLGDPDKDLITSNNTHEFQDWEQSQNKLSNARNASEESRIATLAEKQLYKSFNVGTWWGSYQARLGQLIQSVKNTRSWQIPTAPGERSSLSGQCTALHPQQLYRDSFREGGGLPAGSMRLFWRVMAEVYPGLFNGSEMLNAIELTKRMAWQYGGVAASLGINITREVLLDLNHPDEGQDETLEIDYEQLIRFPNLSSIAAAKFTCEHPERVKQYWKQLKELIDQNLPAVKNQFSSRTRGRPFQVFNTDRKVNPGNQNGQNFNGVMFSSKWLADDMGLEKDKTNILRGLVEQAHKNSGFNNGSPADWWVIVLGDGDGMGKYVSGAKLGVYEKYIVDEKVDPEIRDNENYQNLLTKTRKRMGPATHVALNRALLDFSNRLVPYITERRFCGKVVYSGGDDVMAVLPLADLPEYLLSLRAAWSGTEDPAREFATSQADNNGASGYWHPKNELQKDGMLQGIPDRPLFTMGKEATMSLGIVIAYKSVPLPTVLETLWTAEKERAKKMPGAVAKAEIDPIPVKDGLCFRVIYGSGNVLEALMKGHLLQAWWDFVKEVRMTRAEKLDLSPLLYRLAEELPKHTAITKSDRLIAKATEVIIKRREQNFPEQLKN